MTTLPWTPGQNRICLHCKENIVDSLDAHMEDCPANLGYHHILFDRGTGLREENKDANSS